MPTELLKKLSSRRRSLLSAVAAVAGLMVLATQTMGTAAATDPIRSGRLEACPNGNACLWINDASDPDPAVRADRRALVITPGGGPDLDAKTTYDKGNVRGMTEEFTDNISVGWNLLPTELCLLDTEEYSDGYKFGTKAPLRHARGESRGILVIPPWSDFSKLGGWNDAVDYYTTGQCPRGDIIFRTDTGAIVDSY